MFALISPTVFAVVLAAFMRRSFGGLLNEPIAWWPLGVACFGLEVALSSTSIGQLPVMLGWGSIVWLGALAAMVAVLVRNAALRSSAARWPWAIAALGVSLNLLVVAVNNGHMPQSQSARIAAGASIDRVAGLSSQPSWRNVAVMTNDTFLPWFADVLPEPAWLPLHNVMSIGDLLLACGLAGAVYFSTTPGSRSRQFGSHLGATS